MLGFSDTGEDGINEGLVDNKDEGSDDGSLAGLSN